MIEKIKKLFAVSRPISWPNTAYPFGAAMLIAGGSLDPLFWIGLLYFLIPYNLLMYGVNDVFDYESDMRNPRKGGIEGAMEQKSLHPTIIGAAIITNLPFLGYLLLRGSLAANITLAALVFFVIAYSAKGLRFKEIPVLDSVTSSIHFVGPMIYAMVLTGFHASFWPFVIAFFLWGIASHAFGAVQDIIPDREGSLASIATVFGARNTTRLVFVFYLCASVILFLQSPLAAIVGVTGLIYVGNVLPFLHITDQTSATANRGWRRFIWLNLFVGFVVTITLIVSKL